jgi:beta propeller repeat protein
LNVPAEHPSIQAGIDAASQGDTVVVAPGVYYEKINFRGKNITVTSKDPNDRGIVGYTIIHAQGEGSAVTFASGETSAAVLRGFTLTGGYGTLNTSFEGGGPIYWGGGIYCLRASPTITRNVIANNRGPVVLGNTNADSLISYGGGIACIESNAVVVKNIIRGNVGFVAGGLILYTGQAFIGNNLIYDNSGYIGGGIVTIGGSVIGNTIVGNNCNQGPGDGQAGNAYIIFEPQLGHARVVNNIICNAASGGGLLMAGDWRGGVISCNDIWNNSPGNYIFVDNQTGQMTFDGVNDQTGKRGNISADPLFLNASFGKDYHLVFESPCINAGDPAFAAAARDIDNDVRVYAARIDIGADEYVGYVKPVSNAGYDRHTLEPLQPVTLDGGQSFFYDPCGVRTFHWTQVSGPAATFEDPNAEKPVFTPPAFGEYVFRLVVGDDRYQGEPDEVLILVGANVPPVAKAGADRAWQASKRATLDGTDSFDPDVVDHLTYQWRQVEGAAVVLEDANTATPSFLVGTEGQYVFELVVSDGFAQSEPSRVRCIAVPVTAKAESFNAAPGVGFGPYQPDVSGMKIAYVIQTNNDLQIVFKDMTTGKLETIATGGYNIQPKIDGDLVVWYGGISLNEMTGPVCSSVFVRSAGGTPQTLRARSDTASYSHPAVSGNKVVWVQHSGLDRQSSEKWYNMAYDICGADLSNPAAPVYFTVATNVGRRDPFPVSGPFTESDSVVDICGDLVVWEGQGNIYAADISDLNHIQVVTVCDQPDRQYDPAVSGRLVVWTDERNDGGDIYGADLSDFAQIREFAVAKDAGQQHQATIDGPLVAYVNGSIMTSSAIQPAYVTARYGVLSIAAPTLPAGVMPALDGRTLVWLGNPYGSVQGLTFDLGYAMFDGRVRNVRTGLAYDYLQCAVTDANDGDQIVASRGVYEEKVNFAGKAVTIRSEDPNDPAVVAATILRSTGGTVSFTSREGAGSVLTGFTVTGGNEAVYCYNAAPTITRCTMTGSLGAGLRLVGACNPTVTRCRFVANGAAGIEMSGPSEGRTVKQNDAMIRNCLIAGNRGQGIRGGRPTTINCTIVENIREGIDAHTPTVVSSIVFFNNAGGAQIKSTRTTATYSDVQGGWQGEGNLDADPLFVAAGRWADDVWTAGDYHLRSQGRRWNSSTSSWVADDVTSPCIDAGDPAAELLAEPLTSPGDAVVNARLDMGVYGGTAEASLAPGAAQP